MKRSFGSRNALVGLFALLALSQATHADVQQHSYSTADGLQLRYLIASPASDGAKAYPVWIFEPGDGNVLDTFQPDQYRAMMEQFTQSFGVALVMPELRRNLYVNDLKSYCELDFFHRVTDASRLVDAVKQLPIVDMSKIILFGHSAGGEVVSLLAKSRTDVWGVATYGSGVVSAGELGGQLPVGDEFLNNDCSDPAKYKMRSGKFWRELFLESKLFSTIQSLAIPYLAMFGGADPVTPFDENQKLYADQLVGKKRNFSYEVFPGLDHGGFASSPLVFQKVVTWSR